jgi:hypothetical protein
VVEGVVLLTTHQNVEREKRRKVRRKGEKKKG